jgi:hypothetical protein
MTNNVPQWIHNDAFILTLIALMGAGCSYVLKYFLISRCSVVRCCCLECRRIPIDLTPTQVDNF